MNRHPLRARAFVLFAVIALLPGCDDSTQPVIPGSDRFPDLGVCSIPGVTDGLCGTYTVFENREASSGRAISLGLVILAATGANPEPDPIVFFAGGPGQAVTSLILSTRSDYADIRDNRDLIFIDQRGTGVSHPLICGGPLPSGAASVLGTLFPPDHVTACRQQLSQYADLTLYSTHHAVDDIVDVLEALGFETVNLNGASYGTRTVQTFMKRHPDMVRTAVMNAVAPLDRNIYLHGAANVDTALDIVFDECESDATCSVNYPDIRGKFWGLVANFDSGPIQVQLPSGTVTFDRGDFGYAIRGMLYGELADEIVPWTWEAWLADDLWRFADYAIERSLWVASETFATGLHLSMLCTEGISSTTDQQVQTLTAGTLLGPELINRYRAACSDWPIGTLPPGFHDPVSSPVPTLLISGERDPATPPVWGEEVSALLSNSRHIPMGGHGENGPCTLAAEHQLVEEGSVEDLNTSCPPGG
jgi:pimeloyl-ACP methyl ester carboxylesterase